MRSSAAKSKSLGRRAAPGDGDRVGFRNPITDAASEETAQAAQAAAEAARDRLPATAATASNAANQGSADTLLARLTETRATRLDTVPSTAQWTNTRAAALDRLINDLTAARAVKLDNLDALITSRLGSIKTTVRGTITPAAISGSVPSSASATIPSVTTSKSQLRNEGFYATSVGNYSPSAILSLASDTQISATVSASTNGISVVVGYELTEFN